MNEPRLDSNPNAESQKVKSTLPFRLSLIGVLIIVIALFLPYMTAVGAMDEYIERNPNRLEIASLGLTAGDLENIPIISVRDIITGVYGEDDGVAAGVFVVVLCGFFALTALFVILKKHIAVIIFDLLAFAVLSLLNSLMKEDFISADKYAWGIGYYFLLIAVIGIFATAVWSLIIRKNQK